MLSVVGKVNARLLAKLQTESDAPYNGETLNFTAVSSGAPTAFPALSVVSLGEPDSESTLEHSQQEAVWSTIELKAYTKTSLEDANTLLGYAGDVMYSMFYDKTYERTLSDVEPFCKVARYRRKAGNEDSLY